MDLTPRKSGDELKVHQAHRESNSGHLLRETRVLSIDIREDSSVIGNAQSGPTRVSNPSLKLCQNRYAMFCAIGASLTSILLGFNIGVMNNSEIYLKKDKRIPTMQVELVAGILNLFSLFGSLMAGLTSDWVGRKITIILTAAFFFLGTVLLALSQSNGLLLLGRGVTQAGVGFALAIVPIYIAEVSPALCRGFLTSFPEVSMNLGVLLGHTFNYVNYHLDVDPGRLLIIILGAISFVLLTIGVLTMPESPRWLVTQGKLDDAKAVLIKTYNSEEATLRLEDIQQAVEIPKECHNNIVQVIRQSSRKVWRDLLHSNPSVHHMFVSAVGIHLLQQVSGIEIILLYSPRIFEEANITSSNGKVLLTIILHIIKTAFVLIPTFRLDVVGRKRFLLCSIWGVTVSLGFLGAFLTAIARSDTKPPLAVAICILSLFSYVAWYSIGLGPVTSVYSAEILPLRLRALGLAISVASGQLLSVLLLIIFLPLNDKITAGGTAFFFMPIMIFASLFIYKMMPETRGRSLEDMWRCFGDYTLWKFPLLEKEMKREMERNTNAKEAGASERQ